MTAAAHAARARYIRQAVENSLRRLRTDVIDVYWYHQPDGETPIAETLLALHELVTAGTVRAIGASNFSAAQIEEADVVAREHGLTPFTAIQNEYSLLTRDAERDVLPTCERLGLGFVPYFPLASGLLTGKYRRDEVAPTGTRLAGRDQVASPGAVRPARGFEPVRGGARTVPAARRVRRSARTQGHFVRDRGRHQARPGAGERRAPRRGRQAPTIWLSLNVSSRSRREPVHPIAREQSA